ncbi:MAG: hypothetical protein HZB61_10240 [Nitrospirae bacterium]|nr:hypothetical protein [Nitrospirota bacterium]
MDFTLDDFKERARLMDECYTCKCGSVLFHVLRSYQIECPDCGAVKEMPFDVETKAGS